MPSVIGMTWGIVAVSSEAEQSPRRYWCRPPPIRSAFILTFIIIITDLFSAFCVSASLDTVPWPSLSSSSSLTWAEGDNLIISIIIIIMVILMTMTNTLNMIIITKMIALTNNNRYHHNNGQVHHYYPHGKLWAVGRKTLLMSAVRGCLSHMGDCFLMALSWSASSLRWQNIINTIFSARK